ncbi:MAG: hypothetical protein WCO71_08915 [Pseudomonadota bacterium]
MRSKILKVLGVLILGAMFQSCSDTSGHSKKTSGGSVQPPNVNAAPNADPSPTPSPDPASNQTPDPTRPPVPSIISESDAQTLLTSYCARCHTGAGAKAGVMLSTTDEAKGFAVTSATELEDGSMPPPSSRKLPTDAERAQLLDWFRQ